MLQSSLYFEHFWLEVKLYRVEISFLYEERDCIINISFLYRRITAGFSLFRLLYLSNIFNVIFFGGYKVAACLEALNFQEY